jgi:hypothetical protein
MPRIINKQNDQKALGSFELANGDIVKDVVLGPYADTFPTPIIGAHPAFYELTDKDMRHILSAKPGSRNYALCRTIEFWRAAQPNPAVEIRK